MWGSREPCRSSDRLAQRVRVRKRHPDNICHGRLPAQPVLNADEKGVFIVKNGGSCLDFQHTDRRLHSFTLSESSFSTSFLIRRSMKGFRIMCSLESWSETRSAISNANFHM